MKRSRSSRPADNNGKGRQSLRIIGGQWRGRKLEFASADGLRPTGDRIRETLFNWLMADLPGARCLDAFSGSGALGLEALSRGAGFTQFIESHPQAAQMIADNLKLLGSDKASVERGDCLDWLRQQPPEPFDVVFLDPPFQQDLWPQAIELLQRGWLTAAAAIYIETPRDHALPIPADWHLHREKHAGDVSYRLYYRD